MCHFTVKSSKKQLVSNSSTILPTTTLERNSNLHTKLDIVQEQLYSRNLMTYFKIQISEILPLYAYMIWRFRDRKLLYSIEKAR